MRALTPGVKYSIAGVILSTVIHVVWKVKKDWNCTSVRRPRLVVGCCGASSLSFSVSQVYLSSSWLHLGYPGSILSSSAWDISWDSVCDFCNFSMYV